MISLGHGSVSWPFARGSLSSYRSAGSDSADLGWVWAEGQVLAGPTWVFVLSQVALPPEASRHLDGAMRLPGSLISQGASQDSITWWLRAPRAARAEGLAGACGLLKFKPGNRMSRSLYSFGHSKTRPAQLQGGSETDDLTSWWRSCSVLRSLCNLPWSDAEHPLIRQTFALCHALC